jgi:ribonuclease Z
MPDLLILGTAASVPDAEHDTVALALRGPGWAVLVDCGGSPLHKLARLGVGLDEVRAVILTHRHADHLYGLPMLVQGLWLGGREESLPIYGPAETLDVARRLLEVLTLAEREGMYKIVWRPVPLRQGRQVLTIEGVRITSAPVEHAGRDTLALRFEEEHTGRAIVYSADTEPCPAVVDLAAGADLLVHEATGEHLGHSSPAQAAEVAREAGVERLALIHYPVHGLDLERWRQAAAAGFPGPVTLARDGDVYPL